MVLLWVVLNCLLVAFALVLGGAVPSRERHPLSEKWDGRAGGYGFRTENSWWGDFISFNFMSFLLLTPITFVLWWFLKYSGVWALGGVVFLLVALVGAATVTAGWIEARAWLSDRVRTASPGPPKKESCLPHPTYRNTNTFFLDYRDPPPHHLSALYCGILSASPTATPPSTVSSPAIRTLILIAALLVILLLLALCLVPFFQ